MVSWIIIAILILLVYLFFKAKNIQHKFYTIIVIAFLLFFYVTGSRVLSESNMDLGSFEGVITAGKLYVGWLGQVFANTKNIAGEAIEMDWTGNSTTAKK